jgi:hypothetical protein
LSCNPLFGENIMRTQRFPRRYFIIQRRDYRPGIGALVLLGCAAMTMVSNATAQTGTVTPLQGQSAEQLAADQQACHGTAVQGSGYDPAQAETARQPSGQRLRGAAAGAAAGSAAAEVRGRQYDVYDKADDDLKQDYRQNEAKSAAAAGAVIGGASKRQDRRQQAAQTSAGQQAYDGAYRSCLTSRGYSVQ